MIELDSLAAFTGAYPDDIARITHTGAIEPLFSVPRLAVLASKLPHRRIQALDATTRAPIHNGMPPQLLVQGIEGLNAEILVASIERDPDFDALIERTIRPLGTLTRAAGAPITEVASCIFLSSPNTATEMRRADEARIIFQCRGQRTLSVPEEDNMQIDLPAGTAVYIPQGVTYQFRNAEETSISLLMKMTDDEVAPKKTLLDRLTAWAPKPRRARR